MLRSGTALGAFRMLRASGALRVLMPALDEYLGRRGDPDPVAHERADGYWRLLEALDGLVHGGEAPSTALCIAALFYRLVEREANAETRTLPGPPPSDLYSVATEVLEPFAVETRLPRRDYAHARRIIAHQRRFTQTKSRRFRPLLFMRGEGFEEALSLFKLRSLAWGQGWDLYEAWVLRYERAKQATLEELEAARRQGRRRRRKRRRRSGGDDGPSTTAAPPSSNGASETKHPTRPRDVG